MYRRFVRLSVRTGEEVTGVVRAEGIIRVYTDICHQSSELSPLSFFVPPRSFRFAFYDTGRPQLLFFFLLSFTSSLPPVARVTQQ